MGRLRTWLSPTTATCWRFQRYVFFLFRSYLIIFDLFSMLTSSDSWCAVYPWLIVFPWLVLQKGHIVCLAWSTRFGLVQTPVIISSLSSHYPLTISYYLHRILDYCIPYWSIPLIFTSTMRASVHSHTQMHIYIYISRYVYIIIYLHRLYLS